MGDALEVRFRGRVSDAALRLARTADAEAQREMTRALDAMGWTVNAFAAAAVVAVLALNAWLSQRLGLAMVAGLCASLVMAPIAWFVVTLLGPPLYLLLSTMFVSEDDEEADEVATPAPDPEVDVTLALDDGGLTFTSAQSVRRYEWSALESSVLGRDGVTLELGGTHLWLVPASAFTSPEHREAFARALAQRGPSIRR